MAFSSNRLPLLFEASSEPSEITARGPGVFLRFTPKTAEIHRGGTKSVARFVNASPLARLELLDPLSARANHFAGPSHRWRTGVLQYRRLAYRGLYPGIDLVFYDTPGGDAIEYDFIVAPGADPAAIRLAFDSPPRIVNGHLESNGILHRKPLLFQRNEQRGGTSAIRMVKGGWRTHPSGEVSFEIGAFDRTKPLTIDPVIGFSTLLGGKGLDLAFDAATDAAGNLYVVGGTNSEDFPVTAGAAQKKYAGGLLFDFDPALGFGDAFIAKFDASGQLQWLTYLGGKEGDCAMALAVDSAGNSWVTGFTFSPDFPVTKGVLQPEYGGGNLINDFSLLYGDAFIAKLDSSGGIVYSTYLGGSGNDAALAIAVDAEGNAVVAGSTGSTDFPVSPDAIQAKPAGALRPQVFALADGFVAKINADATALVFGTYLGGREVDVLTGIVLDGDGNIYASGTTFSQDFPTTPASYKSPRRGEDDAVAVKISPSGTSLLYAALIGGHAADQGYGIALDAGGNAYLAGNTRSFNFDTTRGAWRTANTGTGDDVYVAKLNPAGTELIYSTLYGGSGSDTMYRFAVDAAGNAFLAGETRSKDLPFTSNAIQSKMTSDHDLFAASIDSSGASLRFSSYLGSTVDNKATKVLLGGEGKVWLVGFTASPRFPVTATAAQSGPGGSYDVFVMRLDDVGAGAVVSSGKPDSKDVIDAFVHLKSAIRRLVKTKSARQPVRN